MQSVDDIFEREFKQTQLHRKRMTGVLNLHSMSFPDRLGTPEMQCKHKKVHIEGIETEYYNKLNNQEATLLVRPSLTRRKFDSASKFIRDKDGNFVLEEVHVPRDCIAIVTPIKIGVPLKFKSDEGFQYVDYISKKGDRKQVRYIYIVPRKYCYELNQTALVLSQNKMRGYYRGAVYALQCGFNVYMYVIPYRPTSQIRSYVILSTKTSIDYSREITALLNQWSQQGVLYPIDMLNMPDGNNLGYTELSPTLDEFLPYDLNKSLDRVEGDDLSEFM